MAWAKEAMSEVVERHKAVGVDVPHFLYMDCACCNGKTGFRELHMAAPLAARMEELGVPPLQVKIVLSDGGLGVPAILGQLYRIAGNFKRCKI